MSKHFKQMRGLPCKYLGRGAFQAEGKYVQRPWALYGTERSDVERPGRDEVRGTQKEWSVCGETIL